MVPLSELSVLKEQIMGIAYFSVELYPCVFLSNHFAMYLTKVLRSASFVWRSS